ncbi:hypothetical protein HUE46_09420 [Flavobacterium columnare]|uniref:hypothetical protein n=1 Tax=Flavobacterium columnare TaxID=996 RepID=UPI000F4DD90F|nr:hypothetical protein [Flavobacterium columnare]QOG90214.1 hypothetical protein HUE41_09420 [Flavobacterium columnare]QOG95535.1 hypothetical protein HUE43_09420 [Flavobacterium columnare]QOG98195.1 hypothetical protein HUE44_09415 [Flavobacterium columnare]QOH00854.1 hypothetical protein HUE45_09415 [Flavobacterium columnare]QOH03515.1 hypothetical protein HUE46_09420 [Flavobacterium columnare]
MLIGVNHDKNLSLYAFFERANVTISFFLSIEGNPISGMNIRNTGACSGAYDLFNQMMYSLANSN